MLVRQLMNRNVKTCAPDDPLEAAAKILWDQDVGVVPVVSGRRVVGMVTDRDICMASYTRGQTLHEIPVSAAMSRDVFACRPEDPLPEALHEMSERRVRRLPVLDPEGRLQGIISLNDLAREAARPSGKLDGRAVASALAEIGKPRAIEVAEPHLITAL